ncbi:swi2 snf2-containing protein, partial [Cystoisospora suis]
LARALIGWSSIVPSHRWIAAQLPPVLRLLPTDFLHRPDKTPSASSSSSPPPFIRVVDYHTRRILSPSSRVRGVKQRSSTCQKKEKEHPRRSQEDTGAEVTRVEREPQRESCSSSSRRSNRRRRTSPHYDRAPDCDMDVLSSAQGFTGTLDSSSKSPISRQAYSRGKEEVDDTSMRGREQEEAGRGRKKNDSCHLQEGRTRRLMVYQSHRDFYASTTPDRDGTDVRGMEVLPSTDSISREEKDLDMQTRRAKQEQAEEDDQEEEKTKKKKNRNPKKKKGEVTKIRENPEREEEVGEERLNRVSRLPFSSSVGKYRIYALAGALWALGLRYAGSNNRRCRHLLLRYMHYLRRGQCGRASSSSSSFFLLHPPSQAHPLRKKEKFEEAKNKKNTRKDHEEEVSLLHSEVEMDGSTTDKEIRSLYRSGTSHPNGSLPQTHPSSSFHSQDHHLPLYDERMAEREEESMHERFPLHSNPSSASPLTSIPAISSSRITLPRSSPPLHPQPPPPRRRLSLSSLSSASSSLLQSIFTTLSLFSLPLPPPSPSFDESRECLLPPLQTSGRSTHIEQRAPRHPQQPPSSLQTRDVFSSFPSSSSFLSSSSSVEEGEEEEDLSLFLKYASHNVEEEAVDVCALTCCLSLALVSAGSCDVEVLKTLFYERNLRITRSPAETSIASTALTSAMISQLTQGGSSSSSSASGLGEGYESASAIAKVTEKYRQQSQYGVLMLLHQALGIVCMSGGRSSFREGFLRVNPLDISVLLLSFYPLRPPTDACDQRSHLQACRHLWVLATESRTLLPVDLDTQRSLTHQDGVKAKIISMKVSRKSSMKKSKKERRERMHERGDIQKKTSLTQQMLRMKKTEISLPSLLPSPHRLVELKIDHENYYPVVLRNPSYSHLDTEVQNTRSDEEVLSNSNILPSSLLSSRKVYRPLSSRGCESHAIDRDDKEEFQDLFKRKKLFSLSSSSLFLSHLNGIVKKLHVFHRLFSSREGGRNLLFLKRRGHLHLSEEGYERSSRTACTAGGELSKEEKTPLTCLRLSSSRQNNPSRCLSSSFSSASSSSYSSLPQSSLSLYFRFCLPWNSRSSRSHARLHNEDLFRRDTLTSSLISTPKKRSDENVRLLDDLLRQQEAFDASSHGRSYAVIRLAQYLIKICERLLLRPGDSSSCGVGRLRKFAREVDRQSLFRWMKMQGNEDKEEEEDEDRQVYRRLEVLKIRLDMIERKLLYIHSRRIRLREDHKRKMADFPLRTSPLEEKGNYSSFSSNKDALIPLSTPPSLLPPLSSDFLLYHPHHYKKPVILSRDSSHSTVSSSSILLSSSSRLSQQVVPFYRRVLSRFEEDEEEEEKEKRRERETGEEEDNLSFSLRDLRDDIHEDVEWMNELHLLEREVYNIRDDLLMRETSDRNLGENEGLREDRIGLPTFSSSSSSAMQHAYLSVSHPFRFYSLSEEGGRRREDENEEESLWPWRSDSYGEGDTSPGGVLHHPLEVRSLRFLYRFFTYLMSSHLSLPSYLHVTPFSSFSLSTSGSFISSFFSPDLSVFSPLQASYPHYTDTTDAKHAMCTGVSRQQENTILDKTCNYLATPPSLPSSSCSFPSSSFSACSGVKSFLSRFHCQANELSLVHSSADSRRKETEWRQGSFLRLLPLQKVSSEILDTISCEESILRERQLRSRRKYRRLRETAIVTYAISGLLGLAPGIAGLHYYGRSELRCSYIRRNTSPSSSLFSSSSSSFSSRGCAPCGGLSMVLKDVEEEEEMERGDSLRRSKQSKMKGRDVSARILREIEGQREEIEMESGEEETVMLRKDGTEEDQQEGEKKERELRMSSRNEDAKSEKEKERRQGVFDYIDDHDDEEKGKKVEEQGVYTQFVSFMILHDLPLIATWKAFCKDQLQDIFFQQERSPSSSHLTHIPTTSLSLPSSCSREEERKERHFSSARPRRAPRASSLSGEVVSGSSTRFAYPFDVVLTSYEILMNDIELFSMFKWNCLFFDEATRLKSKASKRRDVFFTRLQRSHTFLLTGTPLENNLQELWSLLHFIQPDLFTTSETFVAAFCSSSASSYLSQSPSSSSSASQFRTKKERGEEEEEEEKKRQDRDALDKRERKKNFRVQRLGRQNRSLLHRLISTFVLRRTIQQVKTCWTLPPCVELIFFLPLTSLQKKLYIWLLTRENEVLLRLQSQKKEDRGKEARECLLDEETKKKEEEKNDLVTSQTATQIIGNLRSMQNLFMQLRKCCNHPALFCLGGGNAYPSLSSSSSSSSFLPRTNSRQDENSSPSSSSSASLYFPTFLRSRMEEGDRGSGEASILCDPESLLRDSMKFQALQVIVQFYLRRQEKVVVFSFSTVMLDLVEDFLYEQGVYTARLDGRMNDEERRQALHAFLSTPSSPSSSSPSSD